MTRVSQDNGGRSSRVIRRFTGAVRGSLKSSLPYLLVFESNATRLAANSRSEAHAGRFVLGSPAGRGVAFRTGLILPLARCRNPDLREQLEILARVLGGDEAHVGNATERTALAGKILKESPWADILQFDQRFGTGGECHFKLVPALVPMLYRYFDYVYEMEDDPRGDATALTWAPVPAESYGSLMEWYHGLPESQGSWRSLNWNRLNVALVFAGNADAAMSFGGTQGLQPHVALNLGHLFDLHRATVAHVPDVRLEMKEFGWIRCCLQAGERETMHWFSRIYPPFDVLIAWCKALRDDRTPVACSFDEEGPNTNFEAHRLGVDRVLFLVRATYSGEVHFSCVCSASALAEQFRLELKKFFRDGFDPQHWEECNDADLKWVPLRERLLSDPWIRRP